MSSSLYCFIKGSQGLVHFGLVEIGRVEFSKLERLLKGMLASGNDEWCCVPCSLSCKLFYAPCIPQSHLHKRQKVDSEKVRAKIYYKEQSTLKLRFTKKVTKFEFIFPLDCKLQMRWGDEEMR